MRDTQENGKLGADLRELAAAGSIVDCSVAETPEESAQLEINQVGGVHESMVFELPHGRAGYILDLEIINKAAKAIYVSEIELRMQWEDRLFEWLADPKETGRTVSYLVKKKVHRERVVVASGEYCFSGSVVEYPRDLVLNHTLLEGCSLAPGYPLTGLLLATGGPMPHDLRHGQWLEPTLALTASDHREYTGQIRLWADRLEVDQERATRTSGLYQDQIGSEAGSPLAACNQPPVAEKSRSLRRDGTGELGLRHFEDQYAEERISRDTCSP
jgi:hypothetical protein